MRNVLCLLTLAILGACHGSPEDGSDLPDGDVLAALPSSESGITYAHLDTPEMLPVGPSGIFPVTGGHAVTDAVRGVIVLLDRNFAVTRKIDLGDAAHGILAVASDGDDLVALDGYAPTPKLLRIGADGAVRSDDIMLDSPTAPTGLLRDDVGLVLEYDGGETLYRIGNRGGAIALKRTEAYVWNGIPYAVDAPKETISHERTVRIGSRTGTVRVPNHLGSVQVIGPDGGGGLYVLAEDVTHGDVILVEQSVWRFSADGEALSAAKVPLQERLTHVMRGVALHAAHGPVALVPRRDHLEFWGLTAAPASAITARKPNPLTGEAHGHGDATVQELITHPGCLSQNAMKSNAIEYLSTSTHLSAANINNPSPCDRQGYKRIKPGYLGAPGTYASVSYNWGGWDTPSQFVSAMADGKKAGNMNDDQTPGLACTYGVDCSGFTARVWGINSGSKPGTGGLATAGFSTPSYGPGYLTGDAFIKAGDHVVVFEKHGGAGFYLWESGGEPYGRVVYRSTAWSKVAGWVSRRSNNHCHN